MKNPNLFSLFVLAVLIMCATDAYASHKTNYKFGKVDMEELQQVSHPQDEEAKAAYLYKHALVRFDILGNNIYMITEVHERIKIYDEDAEDYGDYEIRLYKDGSQRESMSNLKAATYNLENGKIITSKLNKKDVFKEEVSEHRDIRKFALPNVKAGSVIEVKYQLKTPWFFTIPTFYFQEYVPVDKAEYLIRIPGYFSYTPIPTGTIGLESEKSNVNGAHGVDVEYAFRASEVPAMIDDEYVLNADDYRSGLKYELYSDQLPGRVINYHVKDWDEISKDLLKHPNFGKYLGKKTKSLSSFFSGLDGKSDEEKVLEIYEYVRNNIKWNGDYGYYADGKGGDKLLERKSGNVGDINLLLINLLKQADLNAYPFLIKSRGRGVLNESFPTRTEFNYLLAYVELGDSYTLLDGTSKYAPLGMLPRRATNLNGLLLKKNSGQIIQTTNQNIDQSVMMCTYDINLDTPSLEGEGKAVYKNYAALKFRADMEKEDLPDVSEEDEEEEDEEEDEEGDEDDEELVMDNKLELTEITNADDQYEDINIKFKETIYTELDHIGDQIFINGSLDFGLDKNPFYQEVRDYPVFYAYKIDKRYIAKIKKPDGYHIESLPTSVNMKLPGEAASFKYVVNEVGENIVIDYNFKINRDFFLPEEYGNLKELYRLIVEKTKEKIVLTNKT